MVRLFVTILTKCVVRDVVACGLGWRRDMGEAPGCRCQSVLLELALTLVVSVAVGAQVGLQLLGVAPVGIAESLQRVVDLIAQIEVDARYQNSRVVRKIVHNRKNWGLMGERVCKR